jgi:16S rRNA (guanine1207-N2)-methyltransferase
MILNLSLYSGFFPFKKEIKMSNQYFENNPNIKSVEHKITFYYKQYMIYLTSDSGIFSKREVDYGTNFLLKSLVVSDKVKDVLDVGCGYGPIGIAMAMEHPGVSVDMIDVNERAIALCKRNIEDNRLSNAHAFVSNLYQNITKNYDIIVTNPPIRAGKSIIYEIFSQAFDHLNDGGELWVVIQKKQGALSALAKIQSVFKDAKIIDKDKGYCIILARRI